MIQWPAPEDVYFDTGVIVAAIFPNTTYSVAARRFCEGLIAARSHVYVAQVARHDLARALRQLATKPGRLPASTREAFKLDEWQTNSLIRSRWLWHGARQYDRFAGQFEQFNELPFSIDDWHRSLDLMAAEALDASDAMHLATAQAAGLSYFATTDSDFRRITSPLVLQIRES